MSITPNARHSASPLKAVKVSEHVYWVGAIDWSLRDFHGYTTNRGSTYNAYLVMGEKITLIDTVKKPFQEEMLSRIGSLIDPSRIDYLISNHAEMDHSGCLPRIIEMVKPEAVFASPFGVKALNEHFHLDFPLTSVADGSRLTLGDLQFSFVETRMLHWPDSMFTFLHNDGVLFSNDAFGMHLASSERFDDEIDASILDYEARTYYANILLPFSHLVTKTLEKVRGLNLPLVSIAPDHGPVWRTDLDIPLCNYQCWAEQRRLNKAVIIYDTMWGSTAAMAEAVADGLTNGGTLVKAMPMNAFHRSEIATEVMDAGALLVGSPTLNGQVFPTIADILAYLKGLKPKGLLGGAFGSYGWSGEAAGQVHDILASMHAEMISDPVKIKYVPTNEALAPCVELGARVAARLHQNNEGETLP